MEFLAAVIKGSPALDGRRYLELGRRLVAARDLAEVAVYEPASAEAAERPNAPLYAVLGGWPTYLESDSGGELVLVQCARLLCRRVRYVLAARGRPREVHRLLGGEEGGEELEVEVCAKRDAPPPHRYYYAFAAWAAALGGYVQEREWPWRDSDPAIVVRGRHYAVRGRWVVVREGGIRVRRRVYELADREYVADGARYVYAAQRGDVVYVFGFDKAYVVRGGAVNEIDHADAPLEALRLAAEALRR